MPILLHLSHSSGDLVADRRAAYAEALAKQSAFAEAAELMQQALDLVPRWTAGWRLLARYLEDGGSREKAINAWLRVQELDALGVFGAKLALAAHGRGQAEPENAYVTALFDDYAPRFEKSLVEKLGYEVPSLLGALIRESAFGRGRLGRDLGCGTGLMGPHLRDLVDVLEGVDLSGRMLAEARSKGLYDRLVQDDLRQYLGRETQPADLITASDVLNYVGPLEPVLEAVWAGLAGGGRFAFSLETHDGPEVVTVRPSLRFAHNPQAAAAACRAVGFELLLERDEVLRIDRGQPVHGLLVVLGRT